MRKQNTRESKKARHPSKVVKRKFMEEREEEINVNPLKPFNNLQKQYMEYLDSKPLVIATGYPGTSKCVTKDTLVPTSKGLLYIDELCSQEGYSDLQVRVRDLKGSSNTSAFLKTTTDSLVRVETDFGYSVECTPEHPLLTFNGGAYKWTKAGDITPNDVICISRSQMQINQSNPKLNFYQKDHSLATNLKDVKIPEEMTEDLAEFCGYLLANACVTTNSVTFSSHNPKIQKRFSTLCKSIFNVDAKPMLSGKKQVGVLVYSVVIKEFVDYLFGGFKTARYKSVPYFVRAASKDCWRALMKGLLDCDSSVSGASFSFITASKDVAEVYHKLLLEFGVIASKLVTNTKGYNHDYWRVTCYGEEMKFLLDRVLYDSIRYSTLGASMPESFNKNKDLIYGLGTFIAKTIGEVKKVLGVSANGTYSHKGATKRFTIQSGKNGRLPFGKEISYSKLEQMEESWRSSAPEQKELMGGLFALVQDIKERNYFHSKVSKVSTTYTNVVVYDLTVPETHSFIANGIVSHNTFIPTVMACDKYRLNEIEKIYLVRPFISKSKSPGFYAGSLQEKASVWLGEIISVMRERLGNGTLEHALNKQDIEFLPLEVVKGRSLKNCFVIVDEAEDITKEEARKLVTRVGENCTMVLSGDIGQSDLNSESGLKFIKDLGLSNPTLEKTVGILDFNRKSDIVRSEVCKLWTIAFADEGLGGLE